LTPLSIYIHIPFCKQKCIYCDFYSITSLNNFQTYFSALESEIDSYISSLVRSYNIRSIYFGGGTPTIVPPIYLERIINKISKSFKINNDIEISIESNPGTITKENLISYRNMGINRISIGVQSFSDNDLRFLSRIHNRKDAIDAIEQSLKSGFDNINIDLIFNLPFQNRYSWLENLKTAVNLPVSHISAYSLIIEEGTPIYKMIINGDIKIKNEDHDSELYLSTINFLNEKGFYIYEVSNFAKSGFECIHNKAYWNYNDYLGLGTSAHSFIDKKRWWNARELNDYLYNINSSSKGYTEWESITPEQQKDEYIMLQLRSCGLDLREIESLFNINLIKEKKALISQSVEAGLLIIDDSKIRLTPKGYSLADEIILRLIK